MAGAEFTEVAAVRKSAGPAPTPRSVSRLVVLDDSGDRALAAELAIHLLAQLPPEITASLPASVAQSRLVQRLGAAYGVSERISVTSSSERQLDLDRALVIDANDGRTPADLLASIDAEGSQPIAPLRHRPASAAEALQGHRVAIVTNIPIHYRSALFESLEERLAAAGAEFRALFMSGVPRDRSWIDASTLRFSHEFVDSYDIGRAGGRRLVPRSVNHVLDRLDPTIVLSAGFSPLVSGRVARWCAGRAAFGIWSGEIPSRSTARSVLRRLQRRRLAGRADFAIGYGWESAMYLRSLRQDLPIVLGRNSTVMPESSRRIPRTPVELLVVSRAERGKALDVLIDAVLTLRDERARLTLIGDGTELPALKARAGGSPRIRFLGALPHAAVLDEYRNADVFLFPSQYDVFGLVLVEAMAAGLAVITSDKPGAVVDLAAPGFNCLVVRDASPEAWTKVIREIIEDPSLVRRLGDAARRTVRDRWTIDHAAEAMVAGFRLGAFALRERNDAR